MKFISRILIQSLFLILSKQCFAQVTFISGNFEDLLSQADSTNKLLMVDAYTDWCGWCKVMDRETFADSLTGEYINSRFVSTKINMEEGFGLDLGMKYRVSGYPQYLFFDAKGHLLARLVGFLKPDEFIPEVSRLLEPENQLPPLPKPLDFEMDYPEFYKNSFKKRSERTNPELEEIQAFLENRDSLVDEVSWGVISRFVSGGQFADSVIVHKDELVNKFGKGEVTDKLASFVFQGVKQAIKDSSEYMLEEALNYGDKILGEEADSYKYRYKLYFFQMRKDWNSYSNVATELAQRDDLSDPYDLNQMAKAIYLNTSEVEPISRASSWMKRLVETDREYEYLETYAILLKRTSNFDAALAIAEEAKQLAIEQELDQTVIDELIESLKLIED